MKKVLEERKKRKENERMEGEEDRIRRRREGERGYLSVQAKLVLFDALTHKPERQENLENKCVYVCVCVGGGWKGRRDQKAFLFVRITFSQWR